MRLSENELFCSNSGLVWLPPVCLKRGVSGVKPGQGVLSYRVISIIIIIITVLGAVCNCA